MAVTAQGNNVRAGFKFHTNGWAGAGIQLASGDGFQLVTSTARPVVVFAENSGITFGTPIRRKATKVREHWGGALTMDWGYNLGVARWIAGLMGAEAVAALTGAAKQHTFTAAANPSVIGTYAWDDGLEVHDVSSLKIGGLKFSLGSNAAGLVEATPMGRRELYDGTGANTQATMASVTLPTPPTTDYVLLHSSQFKLEVDDFTTGAFGAGDTLGVNAFELSITRPYPDLASSAGLPYPDEPRCGGNVQFAGVLGMQFAEAAEKARYLDAVAGTTQKMLVTIAGDLCATASTDKWSYIFELPTVRFGAEQLWTHTGDNVYAWGLPFVAELGRSTPTGFSTAYPQIKVIDETAATHLTNGV